jgi:circadian clock protein KaiC
MDQATVKERVSSGCEQLDKLLGGGFRRGSSILVAGGSGTGKTTLTCMYMLETHRRGEKVLCMNFEHPLSMLVSNMRSIGIDLQPPLESGSLRYLAALPESEGTEQHLLKMLDVMDEFQPNHLVVDAISACKRIGTEKAGFEYLVRVMAACKSRGITCLCTNQIILAEEITHLSGIGLSSLVDTMIALQYVDDGVEMTRRLLVVKSRGSAHSMSYHPFAITDGGIDLDVPEGASDGDVVRRPGQ